MKIPIRYIRDTGFNGGVMHWVEIKAITIFGENVALGKTATPQFAPSRTHASFTVVTDGQVNNAHAAVLSAPAYVTVDLGQVNTNIENIIVWHYWSDGRIYTDTKTEVSVDGVNWTTLFDSAVSGTYTETISGHSMPVPVVISQGDYVIKRGNETLAIIKPTGWQDTQAMGVNIVEMDFSLLNPIEILQGDTVNVYGEEYFFPIAKADKTKDTSSLSWKYKLQFVHHYYRLSNYPFNARNKDNKLLVTNFSFTGDLSAHFALFMQNLNQYENDWTTGVIDSTDIRTITYADNNLLNVLNKWTEEFKTEYWPENKTIHLTKRTGVSGITLGYGRSKGLISLNQTVKDRRSIFTRLIAQGGSTNLPADYGYTNLQLPDSTNGYIEDATKRAKYGVIVATKTFEDIIPERIGSVSQVGDKFTFYDNSLNFDVAQYYLPGITPKIGFQTGQLAGLQFPITGYDNATKKFTIGINEDEKVVQLPNDSIKPAVGDKYSIFYISLPAEYVTDAKNRLLAAATEYYNDGSDEDYSDEYTIICDKYHFQKNNIVPILGFTVNLTNPSPLLINVDKRVSGIKRNLQDEWDFQLTVTDDIGITQTARSFLQQDKVYSLFATSLKQELTTNNQSFIGQLSGNNGYLYIASVKAKAGFADMAQDAIHAFNADLALVANVAREVVSVDYVSGFAGTGHKLVGGVLEVDHIVARKSFETYELIRRKVTGIGGSFAVTDDMKILTVTGSNPYVCTFDTDNNTIPNYLRFDDIVRCQTFDSNRQKYYKADVTAVTNNSFTLFVTEGNGVPASGDVIFRFDNHSDPNRKGLIYMTNSDNSAPFIDFTYGFYTNPSTKTKVRLGNTAGIYDVDFGGFLNGYNLYADGAYLKNLYAKGQIIALPGSNVYNKTETDATIQAINNQIIGLDTQLANYASDGVLNGVAEKAPIKIAYDNAAGEVENNKSRAASLGVSSIDYNAAFLNLQSFVLPLLVDLTSISPVNGQQLRDKFSYYGIQNSLLEKAIQDKQKQLLDNAQTTANNAQATANSKNQTFIGATAPTANGVHDLWFDTTNKVWKKWSGTTWDTVPDSYIGTAAYLITALSSSTEITGGLILNSVMGVRNGGSVTAYVNGVNSNPIAFAAGVTNFGISGSETQKIALKHDGSGFLANGNITWDVAGNVSVLGTVTATAGLIGGFHISGNQLFSNAITYGTPSLVLDASTNIFKFYSGYITSNGLSNGTVIPDIRIATSVGFGTSGSVALGEIRFEGQFIDANRDITHIGGNGVFSNSSNTRFTDSITGYSSNASIVGLLRRGNSQDYGIGFNGRGIGAAIAGIDQTSAGAYGSRTYGGYFNSGFIGGLHIGTLVCSSNTAFTLSRFVSAVMFVSGSSGATMYLPNDNRLEGMLVFIKNASGGNVTISRSGSESLVLQGNSTPNTTTYANTGRCWWLRMNGSWMEIQYNTR